MRACSYAHLGATLASDMGAACTIAKRALVRIRSQQVNTMLTQLSPTLWARDVLSNCNPANFTLSLCCVLLKCVSVCARVLLHVSATSLDYLTPSLGATHPANRPQRQHATRTQSDMQNKEDALYGLPSLEWRSLTTNHYDNQPRLSWTSKFGTLPHSITDMWDKPLHVRKIPQ